MTLFKTHYKTLLTGPILKQKFVIIQYLNTFQPSAVFHIGTSNLISCANHATGFYMKHDAGLK